MPCSQFKEEIENEGVEWFWKEVFKHRDSTLANLD
jgi:hypothetical protein